MKNRTSSPAPPELMPSVTLADLIGPPIDRDIAWPYILGMITDAIKEAGAGSDLRAWVHLMPWPKPSRGWLRWPTRRQSMPIVAKGAIWPANELRRLIAGHDPVKDLCDHIARHWGRVIARDIEEAAKRRPIQPRKIRLSIEPTFVGARIPRSLMDVIRQRPRMRTRGPAIELRQDRLMARITYAFALEYNGP